MQPGTFSHTCVAVHMNCNNYIRNAFTLEIPRCFGNINYEYFWCVESVFMHCGCKKCLR